MKIDAETLAGRRPDNGQANGMTDVRPAMDSLVAEEPLEIRVNGAPSA